MQTLNQPIQSRKKTFQFQPDSTLIENNPLAFEQRREFADGLSDQQLCDYIMKEALRCMNERQEDVSKNARVLLAGCFISGCAQINAPRLHLERPASSFIST